MARTIFNSTEKSNFILNMSTEDYRGYLLKVLLGYVILMPLFCIPLEFASLFTVPGMALSIVGVFAMVFVLIGYMKKATPSSLLIPACLWGGMVLWNLVSLSTAPDINIALMGADGRNEGLLSAVFYGCFFLLSAQLGTESNRRKLLFGLLGMGLFQCIWALLQMLPIGFPSYYDWLNSLLLFDVFLPSGVTGNPIFLAALLTMLAPAAALGAVYSEGKKQRIFCTVCAVLYTLVAVKTHTLLGLCGMGLVLLILGVYGAMKKQKSLLLTTGAMLLAFAVGCGWLFCSPSINGTTYSSSHTPVANQFALYDGAIMWEDGAYRLGTSGYYSTTENPSGVFAIDSIADTYGFQWSRTLAIIGEHPIAGTGADNLAHAQVYNQAADLSQNLNTFDRCYNYYLHITAVLGIPGLLLFLALAVLSVMGGIRGLRSGSWVQAGICFGVIVHLAAMLICPSAITVTPVFWMLAGMAISTPKKA